MVGCYYGDGCYPDGVDTVIAAVELYPRPWRAMGDGLGYADCAHLLVQLSGGEIVVDDCGLKA